MSSSRPAVGEQIRLKIEKLAVGGDGVARSSDFVIFVPDTAPGETVLARIIKLHDNYAHAELLQVESSSSGRVAPRCQHYGHCGGCNWQHLDASTQLQQKALILQQTLEKFLRRSLPLPHFTPSPNFWNYRNRAQPFRSRDKLSFRKRGSSEFVQIQECHLLDSRLHAFFKETHKGEEGERLEVLIDTENRARLQSLREEKDHDVFAFSQVNTAQNEQLVQTVLTLAQKISSEWTIAWDLYAGSGNFSLPLAQTFARKQVRGVELDARLVQKANHGSHALQLKNIDFTVADVAFWLRRNLPDQNTLVIIDPPRAGAGLEVSAALAQSAASHCIYIACHPVSLARDAVQFEKMGWTLRDVFGFEMFPQTDHFETIAYFAKN